MRIKIKRKWIIIIAIVLIIAGWFGVNAYLKKPADAYTKERVSRGEVLQEVSETGSVKATENISLGFKGIGKIASINAIVGSDVKKGDILAELDMGQIRAQLSMAQAGLAAAKNQYNKLINGSTPEDVQTVSDTVASAKDSLQSAYDSSINVLSDAYTKIYNAYNAAVTIREDNFTVSDHPGGIVAESVGGMRQNMLNAKTYLDSTVLAKSGSAVDSSITQMIAALDNVFNNLKNMREQCDQDVYYTSVSATDKSTLDTQKGYINTASTSVKTAQQSISAYKIALQKAENALALKTANPRAEDVDYYKAQVEQAEANVNLYQSQLSDNYLRSPINGKVTKVNIKNGETIATGQSAINLLSLDPFQIKVDIYEQDIVNVKIGDPVKITLVAFPKNTYEGKVISIDPAEKIVDNVVYYEVTVDFPQQPEGIRSGMTADVIVTTNKKENVIRIPKNAVGSLDGKEIIQIAKKGKIEDREITTGLEGNDFYEIVSGVSEGEEIITGKKQ